MTRQEAKDLIHEAGLRATAPRVAVLRTLVGSPKPLSHSEVIGAVGSNEWDQATLYRNLLKLVEAKLARVASQMGGITRYEVRDDDDPHVHPHFSCQTCGKVECLPEARVGGRVEVRWHRSLAESQLQLIGQCPDCLNVPADGTIPFPAQGEAGRQSPARSKPSQSAQRKPKGSKHASG